MIPILLNNKGFTYNWREVRLRLKTRLKKEIKADKWVYYVILFNSF